MSNNLDIVKKSLIRKPSSDDNNIGYGKLPPQSQDLEKAVLGAILLEDCISEVASILKPEHFYVNAHQLIYSAMIRLFAKSSPIDMLTITEDLKSNGSSDTSGGPYYISQLTNCVGSSAHVEYHAMVVKEKWAARQLIATSSDVIRQAYDDTTDPFELVEFASSGIDSITREIQSSQQQDFYSVLHNQIEQMKLAASKQNEEKYIIGLPTGLYSLDRKILGWTEPDLIVVSGRPGEGKTSFLLQSADAILKRGISVGFVSAEMRLEQLNLKLLSLNTDIPVHKLRMGTLRSEEWDKVMEVKKMMANYRLHVYDKPCTPEVSKSVAKTWKKKENIGAFFFDYIQRASIPKYLQGASRNDQITVISNSLKDTALDMGIPVIAGSQMSREIEKRAGDAKRPQLSDLRDGGAIEQDADIIIFVFRPEIHGIKTFDDGSSTENCTEFIVAKHRLGVNGGITAQFIGDGNRFDDSNFSLYKTKYSEHDPF